MTQDAVRLHMTNISGLGAVQLLKSLLPALEKSTPVHIVEAYVPDRGDLSSYHSRCASLKVIQYKRYLPNALSRLAECLVLGARFNGTIPLLVMGDLPIRCAAPQTVFVQNSHLLRPEKFFWSVGGIKLALFRWVFRSNIKYAQAFIVQTILMRDELVRSYPSLRSRVHVVSQPVPLWLLESGIRRTGRIGGAGGGLRLFYPAAGYPHKNHKLLASVDTNHIASWPVSRLDLTLDKAMNPAPKIPWVFCTGNLAAEQMLEIYGQVDALLFLSTDESYGFPLLEAMFAGLPIVCPDLPYARTLCADEAIYFNVDDVESLKDAVRELHRKLSDGYWPDWSDQLKEVPKSWGAVAKNMLEIAVQSSDSTTNEINARDD